MPKKAIANASYTPIPHPATPYKTFESFYPFYLGEHSSRLNRLFHLVGTSIAWGVYGRIAFSLIPRLLGLLRADPLTVHRLAARWGLTGAEVRRFLLVGLVQGYFFAWIGHFFVEKNKPATFKYPLYSLRGDFKLLWEVITFQRSP